jgi:hypothetical protein
LLFVIDDDGEGHVVSVEHHHGSAPFRKRKQWRLTRSEANDGQSNIGDEVFNSSKVAMA